MKKFFLFVFLLSTKTATAQWAVYDHRVHDQLRRINEVFLNGSVGLQNFEDLSQLNIDFSTVELADRTRFITTQEDCGDRNLNAMHFTACQGLRNLRLKTLEQSEALLRVIETRRGQINELITQSRGATDSAGRLQRFQFELQGIQALMQSDAMRLEVLMSAYKQREKMYEVQMTEARRVSDTKRPGAASMGAVPFLPGLMR
jgi:hypothetical protein